MRDGFHQRYKAWLERLDEWCAKHKITRESAVSILYDDSAYNPDGGEDLVRAKDLYWAEGNEFVGEFLFSNEPNHLTNEKPTKPGWYWYEDEEYGPCPVHVDWCGFVEIDDPMLRQLHIDTACGEECYQPLGLLTKCDGMWSDDALDMPYD